MRRQVQRDWILFQDHVVNFGDRATVWTQACLTSGLTLAVRVPRVPLPNCTLSPKLWIKLAAADPQFPIRFLFHRPFCKLCLDFYFVFNGRDSFISDSRRWISLARLLVFKHHGILFLYQTEPVHFRPANMRTQITHQLTYLEMTAGNLCFLFPDFSFPIKNNLGVFLSLKTLMA